MTTRFSLVSLLTITVMLIGLHTATAQETRMPEMPAPIQNLASQGAQVRFLGRHNGLDGWITVKQGKEQYFYVTPDGKGIVMGLLFDDDGKLITIRQLQAMKSEDFEVLDILATEKENPMIKKATSEMEKINPKSPSEKLYASVEKGNWITFGNPQAPYIYVFAEPKCPHCKTFLNELKSTYLGNGKIQVRLIPVGFTDSTIAQSAFLLAAPDGEERWYRNADGDETALPAKKEINTQAIQMNIGIMQAWKFDSTPLTIYRNKDGKIKIMQGNANNIHTLYQDITG